MFYDDITLVECVESLQNTQTRACTHALSETVRVKSRKAEPIY